MATIAQLEARGVLQRYDPDLGGRELEHRVLLASERFARWVQTALPGLISDWDKELSPEEEFDAFMATYCSGAALVYPKDLHPLRPVGDGVWELRMLDLRVFGWFVLKDWFVAVSGHMARHVKDHDLYRGLVAETVRFREALDLDEPNVVMGEDPDAVVSNLAYAP